MNVTPAPVQQLPTAESVTNADHILIYKDTDGKAYLAPGTLFRGDPATINGVNALTIEAGDNIALSQTGATLAISAADISTATQTALNNKVDKVAGKGLSSNDFTDAAALALETAGEKSTSAFSAIDNLLDGLQVPVYKNLISYGAFRLSGAGVGKLDGFHVPASMAGQTAYAALITDFSIGRDSEGGRSRIITDNPEIKTATVGADGSLNVTFNPIPHDCIIVVTTTDIASHYANGNHDDVRYAKVLFTCRYTRNTGAFMGLSDIPAISMADFADKLGYSIRYEEITDMTPEAVATTTNHAVFLYSGSEYYELTGAKPSDIPNQNAAYYRCLYWRKEL